MNPAYHLTILPPQNPQCEAVSQDIFALQDRFGGQVYYHNPNEKSPLPLPRLAFGWHTLARIWQEESTIDIHHFFNPDPYPFPMLWLWRKPIIYTLTGGLPKINFPLSLFKRFAAITVSDERSYEQLRQKGLQNVHLVRAGIETQKFTPQPLALQDKFKLMVGSAPWTLAQFESKGIMTLLRTAQKMPDLHLVFLWRNVLFKEMKARVSAMGLETQVTIINEQVDVNTILGEVHASVTLSGDTANIRPYPHSLMESLMAGKPILISSSIAMSDYIGKHGGGVALSEVSVEQVKIGLQTLRQNYAILCQQASQADFSLETMLGGYANLYQQIIREKV